MIEKTYNVGIYCRLSNDDERDGESVSIENQKLLLQSYVRQRGWNEIAVYCDDGYSGTNFDRPGVKRLIEDAKAKKINLILVKDLSRFGRNYIEFGQYTDYLFPSLGCRFVALNNGIDTMSAASFAVLLEKTEQERRQRTDRLDTLLAEVREYEQSAADIQSWAAVVRKHLHIRELDRETVDELIDRIEVGEKTVVDGKNVRDIKIYYRFVGNI